MMTAEELQLHWSGRLTETAVRLIAQLQPYIAYPTLP